MSFLTGLALLISVFVAVPVLAHLLKRGRVQEQIFAPIQLVQLARTSARQRSRLDDRLFLLLRALLILALALLGAAPLVRCSRVSLARPSGASVALALVIDDSLSMRALTASGKPRFVEATTAAQQLILEAREGDAVAIVLAGEPARLMLSATTDLAAVRAALGKLSQSDRATDLVTAVELGRSAVKQLSHADKRVVVLSDFAGVAPKAGEPRVWAPLPILQAKIDDCAVISAETSNSFVTAQVACTSKKAAVGRRLIAVAAKSVSSELRDGEELGSSPLPVQIGLSSVSIKLSRAASTTNVYLDGTDALSHDDAAPATTQAGTLSVGVVVDKALGSVVTGGSTILEQVLGALDARLTVHPLSGVPEADKELDLEDLLILDDPAAFTPEMRTALSAWLSRGKLAVALFGPRVANAQLGSSFEPFFSGGASWQKPATGQGLLAASTAWLGEASASLENLSPRGEVVFSPGPNAEVQARWENNRPFLFEQKVGRGSAFSLGLPASVDQSDLALRPGFVALLDHFVRLASERTGPRVSEVGRSWRFPSDAAPSVIGPEGPLQSRLVTTDAQGLLAFEPPLLGRYQISADAKREERVATITADEILNEPVPYVGDQSSAALAAKQPLLEISSEIALAALALFTLELALRSWRRFKLSSQKSDSPA